MNLDWSGYLIADDHDHIKDYSSQPAAIYGQTQTQGNLANFTLLGNNSTHHEKMDDEVVIANYGTNHGTRGRDILEFEMSTGMHGNKRMLNELISHVPAAAAAANTVHPHPTTKSKLDLNQNSPKRIKMEIRKGCTRCNCKKSKCLKLYCACFSAQIYCTDSCSCPGCCNKLIHKDIVVKARRQIMLRNPLAFTPKIIRQEIGDDSTETSASAARYRRCTCKKSKCLKKYCECYKDGVGCSLDCSCEGCQNSYNKKNDGLRGAETCEEGGGIEKASQETEIIQKNIEVLPDHNCAIPTPSSSLTSQFGQEEPFYSFVERMMGAPSFVSQNGVESVAEFGKYYFQSFDQDDPHSPITWIKSITSPES